MGDICSPGQVFKLLEDPQLLETPMRLCAACAEELKPQEEPHNLKWNGHLIDESQIEICSSEEDEELEPVLLTGQSDYVLRKALNEYNKLKMQGKKHKKTSQDRQHSLRSSSEASPPAKHDGGKLAPLTSTPQPKEAASACGSRVVRRLKGAKGRSSSLQRMSSKDSQLLEPLPVR